LPRSEVNDQPPPPNDQAPPPPPPPSEEETQEEEMQNENEEKDETETPEEIPEEFMFDPEGVLIDPSLLMFTKQRRSQGKTGRAKSLIFSNSRGRYIKPIFPTGKVRKLAIDATLRSAAPYQRIRRDKAIKKGESIEGRVYVEKSDMREKKLVRKSSNLVIFLVDASGSMALNRMASAKGACMRILADSYTNRDMVSLIPFCGDKADVLLPPSKSITMARRRLDSLPCGGGSPLAHGLSLAVRTGIQALGAGDTGRVNVILITDGRANVSLAKSNGGSNTSNINTKKPKSENLKNEVLDMARKCYLSGIQLLVIDTENKFVSAGFAEEIAKNAQGKYYYLPNASDSALAYTTARAIQDSKL
jgi:magnesium chelatase subunit D